MDRGTRCLIRARCIDNTLSEIGPMLLKLIRNIPNHVIVAKLAISLEFSQVDQF